MSAPEPNQVSLNRVLNLPLLVFYGVGVTIGAGIFALIGEIVKLAGDGAPAAFLLAGLIAGVTGISYAFLSTKYPRAGGEAVFVNVALGSLAGRLAGYGVTVTAIISSAVITLSFSGYLGTLIPLPQALIVIGILLILGFIAYMGVRESVLFAAAITLLEVGTLMVIIFFGRDTFAHSAVYTQALAPATDLAGWSIVFSAAVIAFFAFIGFEDLVNMAEETVNPEKTMPRAIVLTLIITVILYTAISLIAIDLPDRQALVNSSAPLATLYESVTGYSGKPISAMASIAMINGVLVQVVMASRVIYGMTTVGLAPAVLGKLDARRRTPVRAIIFVTLLIALLCFGFSLLYLAQATSLVTLSVFLLVNLALWRIGASATSASTLHRWRHWGLLGALLTGSVLVIELIRLAAQI